MGVLITEHGNLSPGLGRHLYTPTEMHIERVLQGDLSVGAVDTLYHPGGTVRAPGGGTWSVHVGPSAPANARFVAVVYAIAGGYELRRCTTNWVRLVRNDHGEEGIVLTEAEVGAMSINDHVVLDHKREAWVSLDQLERFLRGRL